MDFHPIQLIDFKGNPGERCSGFCRQALIDKFVTNPLTDFHGFSTDPGM
jgi:hypothetical protein